MLEKKDTPKARGVAGESFLRLKEGLDVDLTEPQWEAMALQRKEVPVDRGMSFAREVIENADLLTKKSMWDIGGGWLGHTTSATAT